MIYFHFLSSIVGALGFYLLLQPNQTALFIERNPITNYLLYYFVKHLDCLFIFIIMHMVISWIHIANLSCSFPAYIFSTKLFLSMLLIILSPGNYTTKHAKIISFSHALFFYSHSLIFWSLKLFYPKTNHLNLLPIKIWICINSLRQTRTDAKTSPTLLCKVIVMNFLKFFSIKSPENRITSLGLC